MNNKFKSGDKLDYGGLEYEIIDYDAHLDIYKVKESMSRLEYWQNAGYVEKNYKQKPLQVAAPLQPSVSNTVTATAPLQMEFNFEGMPCSHNFVPYEGIMEVYQYCVNCDEKKK